MQNEVDIKSWELCKIEMGIIYVVVRHTEDSHGIYIYIVLCADERFCDGKKEMRY